MSEVQSRWCGVVFPNEIAIIDGYEDGHACHLPPGHDEEMHRCRCKLAWDVYLDNGQWHANSVQASGLNWRAHGLPAKVTTTQRRLHMMSLWAFLAGFFFCLSLVGLNAWF